MASGTTKLDRYRSKRDFSRTAEPGGEKTTGRADGLAFVIQKHAASHLHYDLRLELGGVMKSWAVPKGPSLAPSVRRMAIEVEDHPIEYNDFEGTIPAGEYGGGTVLLWDRGTYTADEKKAGETDQQAIARGYRRGSIKLTFQGERLRGSFALVRTRRGEQGGEKSQWLLIKHQDDHASVGDDVTAEETTSVASGRSMEEIARGTGGRRVWRSNHAGASSPPSSSNRRGGGSPALPPGLEPMLARSASVPPDGEGWTFEPKYDGIRVLAYGTDTAVALVTRNGNEKSKQFPEVAEAVRHLAAELGEPVVLDGEIVALEDGRITRFEALQGRMHVKDTRRVAHLSSEQPTALVAFDLLLVGDHVLLSEPWTERRPQLEEVLLGRTGAHLLLGETTTDRKALQRRAESNGWEGLVAKRTDATYRPGTRSDEWRKLKLENRQELVVGGWTEPRNSRKHLGALLLGYYREGTLVYAGHTGTGFTRETLEETKRRLKRLARKTSPFTPRPKTNQPAHWVTPRLVVEVKFNEWTSDGKLRQPVFLGFRDDKDAREVVREGDPAANGPEVPRPSRDAQAEPVPAARVRPVLKRLETIAASASHGGVLRTGGAALEVTSLDKVFFPDTGMTKGDLLRYYTSMAALILPWMRDRPLVLRRYPDGIAGEAFYQQSAPDRVPEGVRVERVKVGSEAKRRLVGGDLATLLYSVQVGAVSYDPWHSRVGHLSSADYAVVDLDPGAGVPFDRVVEVALRVKEEMDGLGLHGAVKTSGSSGLHIYLPLPPDTPLEAATLAAQILSTRVARRYPKIATIERMTKRRPRGTVYVDYLQNLLGKTVAGVYAVRAKPHATVSTPLRWEELTDGLAMEAFTLQTVPERVAKEGDLWAAAMSEPNSLDAMIREGAA